MLYIDLCSNKSRMNHFCLHFLLIFVLSFCKTDDDVSSQDPLKKDMEKKVELLTLIGDLICSNMTIDGRLMMSDEMVERLERCHDNMSDKVNFYKSK